MTIEITTASITTTQEAAITEGEENRERRQRRPTARPNKEIRKMWKRLSTYIYVLVEQCTCTNIVFASTLLLFHFMYRSVAFAYVLLMHTATHTHLYQTVDGPRYYERARKPPKNIFIYHSSLSFLRHFAFISYAFNLGCLLFVDFFRRSIFFCPASLRTSYRIELASWCRHAYDATTARTHKQRQKSMFEKLGGDASNWQ